MFDALQAVSAMLKPSAFGRRPAAAPVVLPLAMVASRLLISLRHGTNSRGRLRLHGTCYMLRLGAQTPKIELNI